MSNSNSPTNITANSGVRPIVRGTQVLEPNQEMQLPTPARISSDDINDNIDPSLLQFATSQVALRTKIGLLILERDEARQEVMSLRARVATLEDELRVTKEVS